MTSQIPAPRTPGWADRPLELLRSGIPLSLLLDLADPLGPPSEQIFGEECGRVRRPDDPACPRRR